MDRRDKRGDHWAWILTGIMFAGMIYVGVTQIYKLRIKGAEERKIHSSFIEEGHVAELSGEHYFVRRGSRNLMLVPFGEDLR